MLKNRIWLILIATLFLVSLQNAFAWWNSDWQYKRAIQMTTSEDYNKGNIIKIASVNMSSWTVCSDLNDVVVVDETLNIDLNRQVVCNGTKTDCNVFFELADSLPAGTYNTRFYLYYNNSACPSPKKDFSNAYTVVDDIEDGDISDWTIESGSFSASTTQARGTYSILESSEGWAYKKPNGTAGEWGMEYSAWIFTEGLGTGDYAIVLLAQNDVDSWASDGIGIWLHATNGVQLRVDIGGTTNFYNLGSYSNNTWYKFRFVIDWENDVVSVYYYDSTETLLESATNISIAHLPIYRVKLREAGTHNTYYDDIVVTNKILSPSITLGSEETSGPTISVTATINSPNGGEVISASSTTIDFNVEVSGVSNPEVHAKIAYSTTQGAFENVIEADLNLNNYANISNLTCDDANFEDSTNCQYTWDLFDPVVPDGNYYIDINAWETSSGVSGTDSSDGKFEIDNAPEFSTDFSYTQPDPLDPENGITEVTSTFTADLTYKNVTPASYTYTVDGNTVATTDPTDYNFTTYGDFNVCLFVVYDYDYNADTYEDGNCKTIHVKEYPQGLDFTPTDANVTQAKDFTASVSGSQPTITQWYWFFPSPDTNYLGQTATHTFNATGTMQVCVTAQNTDDLNRTKCKDVTVYGVLIVHFYDEQTNAVVNASVNFLDNNYNTTGTFTYYLENFANTSSSYTLTVWDVNRHERHLILDLNRWSYYDINMLLLDSDVGRNVLFQFFAPDESTLLSNATVRVKLNDAYVDATVLDSDAKGTLFLDTNNAGYSFHITTPDGNQYEYSAVIVIVKIPKQEDDLAVDITPFEVDVGGLAKASYTNQTTDLNFYVLGNTYEYYRLKIGDWNADNYYDRYYYVRIQGAATTYTIQPYLVSTETGLLSAIYGINSMGSPLGRVMFVIQKQLNDIEPRTVQTVVTDDTGKGLVSWVVNDTYYVKVYYNNQYVGQVQIMPSSSTYYITVTTETTGISGIEAQLVYVQFSPSIGRLALNDLNQFHFDVNVYSPTSSITSVTVTASCKGNTVYSETKSTNVAENAIFSVDINKDDVSSCKMLEVTVSISTPEGTITKKMTYGLSNTAIWLWGSGAFSTIKNLLGDWVAMLIALLITIMAVGAVAFKLNPNPIALGIVAGAIMGFFTYVGWIPLPVFVFACLGAGAVAMLTFRWQVSG